MPSFAAITERARNLARRDEAYEVMDTLTDDPPAPSKWPDTVWWKRAIYIDQAYAELCMVEATHDRIANGG